MCRRYAYTLQYVLYVALCDLGSNTGSKLSRAAYARLYAADFPPILDRHKQDAEVVNPNDYLNFVMAREESDQLQCNEIILQFLAFSRYVGETFNIPFTLQLMD